MFNNSSLGYGILRLSIAIVILMISGCTTRYPSGVHLFILSGQSNMAMLNIDQDFTPLLEAEFGKKNVIVIKHARGGERIHRWYKKWVSAGGHTRDQQGDIYDQLMRRVKVAIEHKTIASVTFIWMQGESDAYSEYYASVYETSMHGLYRQLQEDLHHESINWVIGRISDFDMRNRTFKRWVKIREIQVKVAESSPRFTWINTDDLNDGIDDPKRLKENDLHYSESGYKILGQRFAESAIELIKRND